MRFQVPQFTEVEDKIIGPLTFKQFIYLAGGGGLVLALYTVWGLFWAVFFGAPVAALAVALAFLKINNRPLVQTLEAAFKYILSQRLYLWKHRPPVKTREAKTVTEPSLMPKLSNSNLKNLSWQLDIKGNLTGQEGE